MYALYNTCTRYTIHVRGIQSHLLAMFGRQEDARFLALLAPPVKRPFPTRLLHGLRVTVDDFWFLKSGFWFWFMNKMVGIGALSGKVLFPYGETF